LRKVFLLHAVRHASRRGGLDASSRCISGKISSSGRNERNELRRRRDGGLDEDDAASSSFIAGRNETNEKTRRRRAEGHVVLRRYVQNKKPNKVWGKFYANAFSTFYVTNAEGRSILR
jgi:hypothetical protein